MSKVVDSLPDLKSFTGYKAVVKNAKSGKYYSTFTGQEFKVGPVPDPPEFVKRLIIGWSKDLDRHPLIECVFYDERFVGHTSVFMTELEARKLMTTDEMTATFNPDDEVVIVEVELSGDMLASRFCDCDYLYSRTYKTISGSIINSIKECVTI